MSTTVTASGTISYQSNTAGNIQNWALQIQNLFTNGGWTQTADTGQTAAASLAATTAGNQVKGYQVWKMADSLAASYPVFVKIEFGTGPGANTSTAGVWITIGTGSDGAGNITGSLLARTQSCTGSPSQASAAGSFFGSAASNRICFFMLGCGGGIAGTNLIVIERTKDGSGGDTNEGLLVTIAGSTSTALAVIINQYIRFIGNTLPNSTSMIAFAPSGTTWADGAGFGVCPVRYNNGSPSNPGTAMFIYMNGDTPANSNMSVTIYGTSHTYRPLGTTALSTAVVGQANASIMLLME